MSRLFVNAINVHQGGGAVLLCDLLRAIPLDVEAIVHVDARMNVPADLPDHVCVKRVEPTLRGRFAAERSLVDTVAPHDQVLCFGNLPPIFRLRSKVVVFLQNRYLIDPCAPLGALPIKLRIRTWLERAWLRGLRLNASQYIVQTPSMQTLATQHLGVSTSCEPFAPVSILSQTDVPIEQRFDFIYVASGEGHKNHRKLLEAWCLLAEEGLHPSLVVTLDTFDTPDLLRVIEELKIRYQLRITNLGIVDHQKILQIYSMCDALIYPSSFESFGLPLTEAKNAGLAILAPELDYVRDIIDPDQTFDAMSSLSISRAVKRYLLKHNRPKLEILNATQFLHKLLGKTKYK